MSTTKNLGGTRKHLPYVDSFSGHRSFVEVIRRGRDKKQSILGDDKSSPAYNDFNQNLTFDVVEGNMEWSSRSAVAYARSPETIPNLHEYFSMEGVSCCLPGPMGAFSIKVTEEPCLEVNPSCVDKRKVVETWVGKSNPSTLGRKTSVVGVHENNVISKTK
uniref:Uncharacterized protein n=1 Tax=Populus trichocarpa TaxID=3694 RepID=U7DX10_POPTR